MAGAAPERAVEPQPLALLSLPAQHRGVGVHAAMARARLQRRNACRRRVASCSRRPPVDARHPVGRGNDAPPHSLHGQGIAVPRAGARLDVQGAGGFPVERDGSDRGPLRHSLAILQNGEPLAVYPEGTRQHGREIQPLQSGAAYLAIKTGVPILPVAIAGSEEPFRGAHRLPRFGRGVVLIGEPIQPPRVPARW